ncbi:MAG: cohesin domain-containing protein, partial [Patescibacteria group bacterium]|nr:cohesin domain-containing protein [Patescibacteria group bacterium]
MRAFPLFLVFVSLFYFGFQQYAYAQTEEPGKATLFLSPRIETLLAGSTFDVSVVLDTRGNNINAVELNLKFSPDKLTVVKPSGRKSFFSIWHELPIYSNAKGTARFVGGIPEGITTESGLVTTITFRAKATGKAIIEILPSSKVLASDGLGTNILSGFGRGVYTIEPRPPGGARVFSETHPFQ